MVFFPPSPSTPWIDDKRALLFSGLDPITLPTQDTTGHVMQIWRYHNAYLGAILDKKGQLTIIPSYKIHNGLQPQETGTAFLDRIASSPKKKWTILSDPPQHLTIWPHLIAAGDPNNQDPPLKFPTQVGHIFRNKPGHLLKDTPENRKLLHDVASDPRNFVGKKFSNVSVYVKPMSDGQQVWVEVHHKISEIPGGEIQENTISNGGVNPPGAHRTFIPYPPKSQNKNPKAIGELFENTGTFFKVNALAQRFFKGNNDNPPRGPWPTPRIPPDGGPKLTSFRVLLQQTGLVRSYNASQASNFVPEKGGSQGEIGGVACRTSYIERLFDQPEAVLEDNHFFCFPTLPDGKMPFTEEELGLILRELAIGIYVHGATPFFSLHFQDKGTDLFPVIHPVYENTLVGRVISMLDYIMKGYLNGGVYQEHFIDGWYRNPDWKRHANSALKELIDFSQYCAENMEGPDKQYLSLESLCQMTTNAALAETNAAFLIKQGYDTHPISDELYSFEGFQNSFRIISKQKSLQKEENLFVIDADFDVFYDIKATPLYQEALDKHIREHGKFPTSHLVLLKFYDHMKEKIHDHMVKMPLCQKYFSQLALIHFFSMYFSTLKNHRKVPCLPLKTLPLPKGCPPLFPHLPVIKKEIKFLINLPQTASRLVKKNTALFRSCIAELFDHVVSGQEKRFDSPTKEVLKQAFEKGVYEELLSEHHDSPLRTYIEKIRASSSISKIRHVSDQILDSILDPFEQRLVVLYQEEATREDLSFGVPPGYTIQLDMNTLLASFITKERQALADYMAKIALREETHHLQERHRLQELFKKEFYEQFLHVCLPVVSAYIQSDRKPFDLEGYAVKIWERQLRKITKTLHKHFPSVTDCSSYSVNQVVDEIIAWYLQAPPVLETLLSFTPLLRERKETSLQACLDHGCEHLPNGCLIHLPCSLPFLPPDRPYEKREISNRIVGGCGLDMNAQIIRPSSTGKTLLENYSSQLSALEPETLLMLKGKEGASYGVLRLFYEDLPPTNPGDYQYMEQFFLAPEGESMEQLENRLLLQDALGRTDKEAFLQIAAHASSLNTWHDRQGKTPLHFAACISDPFYVTTLLQHGLSPLAPDCEGYLPVHYAAMHGHPATLQALLTPNTIKVKTKSGATPLFVAIQNRQASIVEILLNYKAPVLRQIGDTSFGVPLWRKDSFPLLTGGYTPLHSAIHEGDNQVIQALLRSSEIKRQCLNVCALEGGTPLMLACESNQLELGNQLLALGANPATVRRDGTTALEIALRKNNPSLVQALMQKLSQDNQRPSSLALKAAAEIGDASILSILSPHIYTYRNFSMDNALHIATRSGNLPGALYLIENCPDPSFLSAVNIEGQTPGSLAAAWSLWKLIIPLYRKGVVFNWKELLRAKYHHFLHEMMATISLDEETLQEYALTAAQAGNTMALTFILIPKGADLEELQGPRGWGILHYLAHHDEPFLFRQQIALTYSLHHEILDDRDNSTTLFSLAASRGSRRVLPILLQEMSARGVSPWGFYKDGLDIELMENVLIGNTEDILCEFFDYTPWINSWLNPYGTRPLHLAAQMGSVKSLQFLMSKGADCEVVDLGFWTPLEYAIRAQAQEAVSFLLEKGSRVTDLSLYVAATLDTSNILSLLLKHQSNPQILYDALIKALKNHNNRAFFQLWLHNASFHLSSSSGMRELIERAGATGQYDILHTILQIQATSDNHVSCGYLSPLQEETLKNHPFCYMLLLEAGYAELPSLEKATSHGIDPSCIQAIASGELATSAKNLTQAIEEKKWEEVRSILEGLPLEKPLALKKGSSYFYGPPLHLLLRLSPTEKSRAIVQDFLKRSNLDLRLTDEQGNTLAHILLEKDLFFLDWEKVDFSQKNHAGKTPLHIAAQYASLDQCNSFLQVLKSFSYYEFFDKIDNKGRSPLFYAIEQDREDVVLALLHHGVYFDKRDYALITPLGLACQKGFFNIVKILLQKGADPDQWVTFQRLTPLQYAVVHKQKWIALLLLAHGANRNLLDKEGNHLLHYVVQTHSHELLNLLKAANTPTSYKTPSGRSLAHAAALSNNISALEILLKDAPEEIESPLALSPKAKKQCTLLGLACMNGEKATANWLLEEGADFHPEDPLITPPLSCAAISKQALTLLPLFDKYRFAHDPLNLAAAIVPAIQIDQVDAVAYLYCQGLPVDFPLQEGSTGLHLACLAGAVQTTGWLLHNGADIHMPTRSGALPLELAAQNSSWEQFRLLLDWMAEKKELYEGNSKQETLLHLAVYQDNLHHVVALIQKGVALNAQDSAKLTPLHIAAKNGYQEIVQLLLALGADTTLLSRFEKRAEELALDSSTQAVFRAFSSLSPDPQQTPLHRALRSQALVAARILVHLQDDSTLEQIDAEGYTPLHLAVRTGQKEIILLLLQKGVTVDSLDGQNRTPLWHACMTVSDLKIADILLQAGADPLATSPSVLQALEKSSCKNRFQLVALLKKALDERQTQEQATLESAPVPEEPS